MAPQPFTFDDLKLILIDRVGIPADDIPDDPGATFADVGLDSLALVEVHLAIEQEHGLAIPEEDAAAIATLGGAVDYVNRRMAEEEVVQSGAHR
jgi:acyl carrier protein